MNQRQQILEKLRQGPACGAQFAAMYINRYSARIAELRSQGYVITKRPCRLHDWHRGTQWVYELEQERLFA